jgi:RES domain
VAGLPGPHHPPPRDLARRDIPVDVVNRPWFRFHRIEHAALYWGRDPPRSRPSRWDAPNGEYGVLYVGADERCAFVETFGHRTGIRLIQQSDLATRYLSRILFDRPLRLVTLTGANLARLGVDARLFAAHYVIAQKWSRAFHRHPSTPDGILYPSRHDETRLCAAVFDRAGAHASERRIGTLADPEHAALLASLLDTYQFGLLQ